MAYACLSQVSTYYLLKKVFMDKLSHHKLKTHIQEKPQQILVPVQVYCMTSQGFTCYI